LSKILLNKQIQSRLFVPYDTGISAQASLLENVKSHGWQAGMLTDIVHLCMRHLLLIFLQCLALSLCAQFTWVQVGVNGLTCSQCSRSVEMSIRKLDFVADVQMNLEHTEGKILLKSGTEANVEKIAQAVFDAGFSVRYLTAGFVFDHTAVSENSCFSFSGGMFQFLTDKATELNGETTITFIGKKFLPQKEYKTWKSKLQNHCGKEGKKVYYITL
jgi:copper chaperone CopZ